MTKHVPRISPAIAVRLEPTYGFDVTAWHPQGGRAGRVVFEGRTGPVPDDAGQGGGR